MALSPRRGRAEGELAQRLNALVSRQVCAEIAREIGVPEHVRLGKQARDDGAADSDNVLGDIMESLLGASFLERGFDADARRGPPPVAAGGRRPRRPLQASQERAAGMGRGQSPQAARIRSDRPLRPRSRGRSRCGSRVHNVGEVEATAAQQAGRRDRGRAGCSWRSSGDGLGRQAMTRCGVVAVIGAPNAGKSTLVNQLGRAEGRDHSAKAQTTRARLLGHRARRRNADHPRRHAGHLRAQAPARPGDGQRRLGRRAERRRDPAAGRSRQAAPARARAAARSARASGPSASCWCSTRSTPARRSRCWRWRRT